MDRKEKNHLKNVLNQLYSNKNFDDENFQRALNIVKKFEEVSPFFYNFNMGKILILANDLYQAKYYLEKALELDNENASVYYFLYKLDVRLGNFDEAFLDLFKYKELCSHTCDVSLPLTVLEQLLDINYNKEYFENEDYEIIKTNYYGIVDIDNNQVLNLYHEIIDLLNQKKYYELTYKVNELNSLVNRINYNIEIDTFKLIVDKMLSKAVESNVISLEKLDTITKEAISNKKTSNKDLLIEIDRMLDIDLEKALVLYKYVDKEKNLTAYYYIKHRIYEKEFYKNYTENRLIMYNKYTRLGRLCAMKKDWDNAYKYYSLAWNYIKHPTLKYYFGKILFKKGDYKEALKYLLEYIKHGGEKYQKALLYLAVIFKEYNNQEKVDYYVRRMEYLDEFFKSENKVNCGFLKENLQEKVEVDFIIDDSHLNIDNYYEYTFKNKILFIRKMFLESQTNLAEKLLKELIPNDKEEKNMLNELVKDKQLLKRKAKFGN